MMSERRLIEIRSCPWFVSGVDSPSARMNADTFPGAYPFRTFIQLSLDKLVDLPPLLNCNFLFYKNTL